jgi:hypothetical protein
MQPLVYVDMSEVREGALGQLRDAIRALAGFVEENEPRLGSYSVYFSEDGRQMTVIHVHTDSASLAAGRGPSRVRPRTGADRRA